MVTIDDMYEAYLDCRKNKRTSKGAILFEMHYFEGVYELVRTVNDRTYKPLPSDCFIVTRPRKREVFAAQFRDRILHHYVALRLEPLFEKHFNDRTFNCRKGKGQQYGVSCLRDDIYQESNGYAEDCYIMTLDISGFFMSINKSLMASVIDDFVVKYYFGDDKEDVRWMCRIMVMQRPQDDCIRKTPLKAWDGLPKNKSLFTNDQDCGLAIGNLFVQLFANWFMNDIDWWMDGRFRHGRYVDDIYLVDKDKQKLLNVVPVIREMFRSKGLTMNERKFYLQHYTKGVKFCGAVVKPNRIYTVTKTMRSFRHSVKMLNKISSYADMSTYRGQRKLESAVSSVNSYLGLIGRNNEHNIVQKTLMEGLSHAAYKHIYVVQRNGKKLTKGIPFKVKVKAPYKKCRWDYNHARERFGGDRLRLCDFHQPRHYRRAS